MSYEKNVVLVSLEILGYERRYSCHGELYFKINDKV